MPHPSSTASLPTLFLALGIGLFAASPALAEPPSVEPTLALSADMATFVGSLDEDQSDTALYAFDDDERFDLQLAPLWLEGLTINEMTDAQWRALRALLGHVLSPIGLEKMDTIRSLEREVAETEGGLFGFIMDRIRDPKRYFLAIFGSPSPEQAWGFRFDGHHLSLNATAVPNQPIAATPLFLGGQPRAVPEGLERAGLRVLRDEEELAVEFLNALTVEERARAFLPWIEGSAFDRPMGISEGPTFEQPAPAGLDRGSLGALSRARLDSLIEVHLANYSAEIAARYRAEAFGDDASSGLGAFNTPDTPNAPVTLQYASVGNTPEAIVESGRALYYRIQAGGLSIEFDDTAVAADHIHVVFRHADNDFGRDLLGEHLSESHADSHAD